MESMPLLFLFSIVSIVVSFGYMWFMEKKQDLATIAAIISSKGSRPNIILLGVCSFLCYFLLFEGVQYIDTGSFNALIILQILVGIRISVVEAKLPMNVYELVGFCLSLAGIATVLYNSYRTLPPSKQLPTQQRHFLYGVACLTLFACFFVYNELEYTKVIKEPFSTIFVQTFVMFVISMISFAIYKLTKPSEYLLSRFPPSLPSLLYVLAVPIFMSQYLPALLEFIEYDYLTFVVIAFFLFIQACLGWTLDSIYFHHPFTPLKGVGCVLLAVGTSLAVYGFHIQNESGLIKKHGEGADGSHPIDSSGNMF